MTRQFKMTEKNDGSDPSTMADAVDVASLKELAQCSGELGGRGGSDR